MELIIQTPGMRASVNQDTFLSTNCIIIKRQCTGLCAIINRPGRRANPRNEDTPVNQDNSTFPKVSRIERFHCISRLKLC